MDNILFAKVFFPSLDKEKSTFEIMKIDKNLWFWDTYRSTNMLSLMTKKPIVGLGPIAIKNTYEGEFQWLPYTPSIIVDWFETHIFPWMGTRTRIMALLTEKKNKNFEHIDCDEKSMNTKQHKFRIVLKGKTETLYFKTSLGDVYVPSVFEPFIMDGSWPHGMNNFDNDFKLTLAAGAPWTGNKFYNNIELMMKKTDYSFPPDYKLYFNGKKLMKF